MRTRLVTAALAVFALVALSAPAQAVAATDAPARLAVGSGQVIAPGAGGGQAAPSAFWCYYLRICVS